MSIALSLSVVVLLLLAISAQARSIKKELSPKNLDSSTSQSAISDAVLASLQKTSPSKSLSVSSRVAFKNGAVVDPEEVRFNNPRSDRFVFWPIQCRCSPSGRGASPFVTGKVQAALTALWAAFLKETKAGATIKAVLPKYKKAMLLSLDAAAKAYGGEAVINADAKLRVANRWSFCMYDRITSKNINFFNDTSSGKLILATVGKCNRVPRFTSNARFLDRAGDGVPSESTSPPVTGSPPVPVGPITSAAPTASTAPSAPTIPTTATDPTSPTDPNTSGVQSPSPFAAQGGGNEGCVAVEHLKGYVLQHKNHLLKPVLCSSGFCATPNHGIIVDGAYTSMKTLCSEGTWKCVRQTKWVNNLKLAANRRAVVSDRIVVTPYDVRFPKAAIWAVQILEDVWNIVFSSLIVGSIAIVIFVLRPVVSKSA